MKKFISIFKIICYIILLLEIFFWGFFSLYGFGLIYYGTLEYSIKLFVICVSFIFLSILFFKNEAIKKTNNKKIICKIICLNIFMIIFYIFFMVPEIGIDGIVIILIPIILIYTYIFLNNMLFKNKDIEK